MNLSNGFQQSTRRDSQAASAVSIDCAEPELLPLRFMCVYVCVWLKILRELSKEEGRHTHKGCSEIKN